MNSKRLKQLWKISGWSAGVGILLLLMALSPSTGALLPAGNGLALAQTGAPPPPTPATEVDNSTPPPVARAKGNQPAPAIETGASIVQVTRVSALPENVTPLAETVNSDLVKVPSDNRPKVIGLLDFTLSNGSVAMISVPAAPDAEKILRVAELAPNQLPAPLPAFVNSNFAYLLELNLFNCTQNCLNVGEELHQHSPPLGFVVQAPKEIDPANLTMLHFDAASGDYQVILGTIRPDGSVQFLLPQTSKFVLTGIEDWDATQGRIVYPVIIPAGLPRTGGGNSRLPLMLVAGIILAAALITGIGLRQRFNRKSASS